MAFFHPFGRGYVCLVTACGSRAFDGFTYRKGSTVTVFFQIWETWKSSSIVTAELSGGLVEGVGCQSCG